MSGPCLQQTDSNRSWSQISEARCRFAESKLRYTQVACSFTSEIPYPSTSSTVFLPPNSVCLTCLGNAGIVANSSVRLSLTLKVWARPGKETTKQWGEGLILRGSQYLWWTNGRRTDKEDGGKPRETSRVRSGPRHHRNGLETYLVTFTILYLLICFALLYWTFHFKNLVIVGF